MQLRTRPLLRLRQIELRSEEQPVCARALADLDERFLTLELEILRIPAKDRTDSDHDVRRQPDVSLEHCPCLDHTLVADVTTIPNDRVRPHAHTIAKPCVRRDDRGGM